MPDLLKLNLGCSDHLLPPPWLNVDLHTPNIPELQFTLTQAHVFMEHDLELPWQWEDSSIDEIRAHDIFEHLWPRRLSGARVDYPKRDIMNGAHRVLRPGGILDLFVPTTDGRGAFQDPTHKTFWTPNDLFYYVDHFAEWKRFHDAYGITARFRFERGGLLASSLRSEVYNEGDFHREYPGNVWKLHVRLEAIK